MTSGRNIAPVEIGRDADANTADRLLDAARACIADVGWKRTTLTDVAQRAGVSRMTVYRTYRDMPTLLAELMTREFADLVAKVAANPTDARGWPDQIAVGVGATVRAVRANELFRRAVDLDPAFLEPYLFERRGRSQQVVLDLLAAQISAAQAEGGVRAGDPVAIARGIVLAVHGYALSIGTMTDDGVSESALDAELVERVRRYLAP